MTSDNERQAVAVQLAVCGRVAPAAFRNDEIPMSGGIFNLT